MEKRLLWVVLGMRWDDLWVYCYIYTYRLVHGQLRFNCAQLLVSAIQRQAFQLEPAAATAIHFHLGTESWVIPRYHLAFIPFYSFPYWHVPISQGNFGRRFWFPRHSPQLGTFVFRERVRPKLSLFTGSFSSDVKWGAIPLTLKSF